MEQNKNVRLSKGILEMKFMKKTREQVLKDQEDAESQEMYSREITEEMKKNGHIIFREASMTICKGLADGRLSFGGVNPEVEKLMETTYNKALAEAQKREEKDVSDEHMAKGYSTVINTINNKFKTKKSRNKKFQKPNTSEPLI